MIKAEREARILAFLDAVGLRTTTDITVVINSLDVLERLFGRSGLKVILTSGELHLKARCLVGPSLGALFETLRVEKAFLAVDGISARRRKKRSVRLFGLRGSSTTGSELQRRMT